METTDTYNLITFDYHAEQVGRPGEFGAELWTQPTDESPSDQVAIVAEWVDGEDVDLEDAAAKWAAGHGRHVVSFETATDRLGSEYVEVTVR